MRAPARFTTQILDARENLDTYHTAFTMFALCDGAIEHHTIEKLSENF